ncbi:uncharacterized protein [Argopecten irradians]|uniref:uncharacterized protein isoform X2 n=1 Tax=Argopecten irradians TaxID=31199 RepID=UPI0037238A27
MAAGRMTLAVMIAIIPIIYGSEVVKLDKLSIDDRAAGPPIFHTLKDTIRNIFNARDIKKKSLKAGSANPLKRNSVTGCFDQHNDCASWALIGECTTNPEYMLNSCPDACGLCCFDISTNCASWALTGECTANPAYMRVKCARSCGVCTPVSYYTYKRDATRGLNNGAPGTKAGEKAESDEKLKRDFFSAKPDEKVKETLKIGEKLARAFDMGKTMNRRLAWYHAPETLENDENLARRATWFDVLANLKKDAKLASAFDLGKMMDRRHAWYDATGEDASPPGTR